jgi:ubiquinone/menaquinone biosynthesis C-methylase UbiE
MSIAEKLLQAYFNIAYNPVYDFITARFHRYRELQHRCISKLDFKDNDKVLCVGIGTGNEISHVMEMNGKVNIIGIDYSKAALRRAYNKALRLGKEIEALIMDARNLEFAAGSFDKVICLHVMDFIEDSGKVTNEIFRVLKDGGQFVMTYPSGREDPGLGGGLIRDNIRCAISVGKHPARAFIESIGPMLSSIVYLPLLLRQKQRAYCRNELEDMIAQSTVADIRIEEDPVYRDFIVYGRKLERGGGN